MEKSTFLDLICRQAKLKHVDLKSFFARQRHRFHHTGVMLISLLDGTCDWLCGGKKGPMGNSLNGRWRLHRKNHQEDQKVSKRDLGEESEKPLCHIKKVSVES